ncbi:MAG: hypothetical protein ABIJ42_10035 [Acidobacteriota bacterium]
MKNSLVSILLAIAVLSSMGCGSLGTEETPGFFQKAAPVWAEGRDTEMNVTMLFRAEFDDTGEETWLRLAASTIYRARLNDEFLASGPARGPHGFYRVDEIELTDSLAETGNILTIEVAGYNCNSYYLLDQPSFLQAEISSGSEVLASTGRDESSFKGFISENRIQKVQRFSFQRPFTEAYRYDSPKPELTPADLSASLEKQLIPRGVRYPTYTKLEPLQLAATGRFEKRKSIHPINRDRALTDIGPELKGFPEEELELCPMVSLQNFNSVPGEGTPSVWSRDSSASLEESEWKMVDFGRNVTGFVGAEIQCATPSDISLMFGEVLTEQGDIDALKQGQVRVLTWLLEPGVYRVEAIEPYTMRFLKAACFKGSAEVRNIYLREFAHPEVDRTAGFISGDDRLNRIFSAGVETFRQNSLDIFMDCPSRERAGWLCDSFFTSRVEYDLTGDTLIEDAFFQNYLLPSSFENLPEGMVPMCYPADHYNGNFIPNWALWFIVQIEEYAGRSGNQKIAADLEERIMGILNYFEPFENEDGLLEGLEGWVFVEWSRANDWVQDVNYPSNMHYAAALETVARLYDRPELAVKAGKIRAVIREQSFDGKFFVDNAPRGADGSLERTGNHSEVCQYFAFYFGIATADAYPELWETLVTEFGPDRADKGLYPEVAAANSLTGNMLRMELLSDAGRNSQIMGESAEYLLYMADRTGTLWENDHANASTNHGFASHACHTLFRDVLGLYRVDRKLKHLIVRFGNIPLDSCEGFVPTPDGPVRLAWEKEGRVLKYELTAPADYKVEIINNSGIELQPVPVYD